MDDLQRQDSQSISIAMTSRWTRCPTLSNVVISHVCTSSLYACVSFVSGCRISISQRTVVWLFNLLSANKLLKMSGKSKAFTKEEELLLQDFSRNVSTKSSALFYGNAFIVSAIPIWLFWRIHLIDLYSNLISFVLVTLASTYALALAYKNTKFILKHKIAVKREDAVTKEISRKLAEDKKMSKKEKDERILWKKNEVADYEATTFSIFYNNALFLAFVIVSSFYILKTFTPAVNYILSVGVTSAVLALLSTGSQ